MCYPLVPLSSDLVQDIVDLNQSPEHDADLNEQEDCVCRETENGMKLSC